MKKDKNVQSQRQFRGQAPDQPVDEGNRAYRKEPSPPSQQRKRSSVAAGFQTQARPGLVGMQDYKRKGKRGG